MRVPPPLLLLARHSRYGELNKLTLFMKDTFRGLKWGWATLPLIDNLGFQSLEKRAQRGAPAYYTMVTWADATGSYNCFGQRHIVKSTSMAVRREEAELTTAAPRPPGAQTWGACEWYDLMKMKKRKINQVKGRCRQCPRASKLRRQRLCNLFKDVTCRADCPRFSATLKSNFAVSRRRIHRYPPEFYRKKLEWLETTRSMSDKIELERVYAAMFGCWRVQRYVGERLHDALWGKDRKFWR